MSEVVRDTGPDEIDPDDAPPLAADRPYVDGTAASPEELRAEVRRLSNEDRQHVEDLREEVGDSVAALASRLDVKARVAEKRDGAVATVQQQVGRARTAAAEGAVAGQGHGPAEARRARGGGGRAAGPARGRAAAPARMTGTGDNRDGARHRNGAAIGCVQRVVRRRRSAEGIP